MGKHLIESEGVSAVQQGRIFILSAARKPYLLSFHMAGTPFMAEIRQGGSPPSRGRGRTHGARSVPLRATPPPGARRFALRALRFRQRPLPLYHGC